MFKICWQPLCLIILFLAYPVHSETDADAQLREALALAKAGDAQAMNRVGELTLLGLTTEERTQTAVMWFNKAIALNNSDAKVNMGKLYASGRRIKKDSAKAIQLYQEAVKQKNTKAMYELSAAYSHGEGVKQDKEKSLSLLADCAKLGDENCAMLLKFKKNFK